MTQSPFRQEPLCCCQTQQRNCSPAPPLPPDTRGRIDVCLWEGESLIVQLKGFLSVSEGFQSLVLGTAHRCWWWQHVVLHRTADLGTESGSLKLKLGISRTPKTPCQGFYFCRPHSTSKRLLCFQKSSPTVSPSTPKQGPGEDISNSSPIQPTKAHDHFIIQNEHSATSKAPISLNSP